MSIYAELRAGVETDSADSTQTLAQRLADALTPGSTLALHGDLGVGKTTFTQGLARGLGIEQSVTSPTFSIFTLYRGPRMTLVHLDAYRLESGRQIEALMLDDFLVPPCCLVIEWPEKIADWIPKDALHLHFEIIAAGRHRVRLAQVIESQDRLSRA